MPTGASAAGKYPGDLPLIMCVNPSSRQFQHDPLVKDIARALRVPQAPSGGLCEVDRSFVNGLGEGTEDKVIVSSIINLAKGLEV
jgi:hypothetical protein